MRTPDWNEFYGPEEPEGYVDHDANWEDAQAMRVEAEIDRLMNESGRAGGAASADEGPALPGE